MATTVGDFFAQRLQEWRITRIYGYPGDGISGLGEGLRKAGDKPWWDRHYTDPHKIRDRKLFA